MNNDVSERLLIVNADDFGMSAGVNRGIIRAHEDGIVTSASLMVRRPAAESAAAYAKEHREMSVGLHLDLGEWMFRDQEWHQTQVVVSLDDGAAVEAELLRQLETFRRLVDGDPTHLDSHQHIHRYEPLHSIAMGVAHEMGIVLRNADPDTRYCGAFYGQSDRGCPYPEGISVEALVNLLHRLPPGCTELGCHPGEGIDVDSVYRSERQTECEVLCDPRVREAIRAEHIELGTFADRRRIDRKIKPEAGVDGGRSPA